MAEWSSRWISRLKNEPWTPRPKYNRPDLVLAGISLNFDDAVAQPNQYRQEKGEQWHEVATKLDLAKAYQKWVMRPAREILDEVMREGDAEQREAAQTMLRSTRLIMALYHDGSSSHWLGLRAVFFMEKR